MCLIQKKKMEFSRGATKAKRHILLGLKLMMSGLKALYHVRSLIFIEYCIFIVIPAYKYSHEGMCFVNSSKQVFFSTDLLFIRVYSCTISIIYKTLNFKNYAYKMVCMNQ